MGDPLHCEVGPDAEKDPSSCLLWKCLGLRKWKEGHSCLWVSCVRSARAPTAVFRHVEGRSPYHLREIGEALVGLAERLVGIRDTRQKEILTHLERPQPEQRPPDDGEEGAEGDDGIPAGVQGRAEQELFKGNHVLNAFHDSICLS